MVKIFRKVRLGLIPGNKFTKYLIYAIGEITLVVIGILLAVYINSRITENRNSKIRCTYLEELKFAFQYDIKDVEENIMAFEGWNPKLKSLLQALQDKTTSELDSLYIKINIAGEYIYFGQQSKSKIEELKYSNIDLITNRELKNKILLYQDTKVTALLNAERRYDLVDEERRQFYSKNLIGRKLTPKQLESDDHFFSVVFQKYNQNKSMMFRYRNLLEEQNEIMKLLESELEKTCENN